MLNYIRSRAALVLVFVVLGTQTGAQEERQQEDDREREWQIFLAVVQAVTNVGFKGAFINGNDFGRGGDHLHFFYEGDDYGYPVWAMGMRNGCKKDKPYSDVCTRQWEARLLKAPGLDEEERPRTAGRRLVEEVRKRLGNIGTPPVLTAEAIKRVLDEIDFDWLETRSTECPALTDYMERTKDLRWVHPNYQPVSGASGRAGVLHADKITVEFSGYLEKSLFWGWLEEGTPAAWANDLYKATQSCWKPSASPKPWRTYEREQESAPGR